MAEGSEKSRTMTIQEIASRGGVYPPEAYDFVNKGLRYTVLKLQGGSTPDEARHVSGQQLCEGLREYAWQQWGRMATTVLRRWNITCTFDFGRIVYEMVDCGIMRTTDGDSVEDFRRVYDFESALESEYRIESKA
jgi:uncharacterized repeat protein (TIGR04138 family)